MTIFRATFRRIERSGSLTTDQNKALENIWVRLRDDSPEDGRGGALLFDFDVVLSGINNGGNMGSDMLVSGTVAAARESAVFGVPAIAISQHRLRFKDDYDWTFTKEVAKRVLKHCLA